MVTTFSVDDDTQFSPELTVLAAVPSGTERNVSPTDVVVPTAIAAPPASSPVPVAPPAVVITAEVAPNMVSPGIAIPFLAAPALVNSSPTS